MQHPGSGFIQHVLQKHHLTAPCFHAPHQAERNVLTPENKKNEACMIKNSKGHCYREETFSVLFIINGLYCCCITLQKVL